MKKKELKHAANFDELLDIKYGIIGSKKRDRFELESKAFMIGEMLKEARKKANISQEELAKRTGTKKKLYIKIGKWQDRRANIYSIQNCGSRIRTQHSIDFNLKNQAESKNVFPIVFYRRIDYNRF